MSIQLLGISQAVFKKLHSGPRRPPLLPKAALQTFIQAVGFIVDLLLPAASSLNKRLEQPHPPLRRLLHAQPLSESRQGLIEVEIWEPTSLLGHRAQA